MVAGKTTIFFSVFPRKYYYTIMDRWIIYGRLATFLMIVCINLSKCQPNYRRKHSFFLLGDNVAHADTTSVFHWNVLTDKIAFITGVTMLKTD